MHPDLGPTAYSSAGYARAMTLPRRLLMAATAGVLLLAGCTSAPPAAPSAEPTTAAATDTSQADEYLSTIGAESLLNGKEALDAVGAPTGTENDVFSDWATSALKDWYYRVALAPDTITAPTQEDAITAAYDDITLLPARDAVTRSTSPDKWAFAVNVLGDYTPLGTALPSRVQIDDYSFVAEDGTEMLGVLLYGATIYPMLDASGNPLAVSSAKQMYVEVPADRASRAAGANQLAGINGRSAALDCRVFEEKKFIPDPSDQNLTVMKQSTAYITNAAKLDDAWFQGFTFDEGVRSAEDAEAKGAC
jgi:hypothetical protein